MGFKTQRHKINYLEVEKQLRESRINFQDAINYEIFTQVNNTEGNTSIFAVPDDLSTGWELADDSLLYSSGDEVVPENIIFAAKDLSVEINNIPFVLIPSIQTILLYRSHGDIGLMPNINPLLYKIYYEVTDIAGSDDLKNVTVHSGALFYFFQDINPITPTNLVDVKLMVSFQNPRHYV